jgi:hypothetical protein
VTDETIGTDETSFSAHFESTTRDDDFTTQGIVYWSTGGPLVIDYRTKPVGITWDKYDKADPAFILPWYGYPDKTNRHVGRKSSISPETW